MKICNQADEFILDNINPNYAHDLLYLEGAGVTHPDPGYYIQRTQRDRCFRYLYVMEYVISGKGYIECDGKCLDVQAGDFYIFSIRALRRPTTRIRTRPTKNVGSTSAASSSG